MKVGAEGKKTETLYAWIARNFGTIFVYALSLCIMNGKHVIMWGKGEETRSSSQASDSLTIQSYINKFDNDGELFLRTLSYANFLFTGIDAVRTCSTDQSNKTVPRAMVSTVYFTVLTAFSTIISARAYTSNLKIYAITYPYTAGFKLAIPDIDPAHVMFLCLPGLIGSSLGFAYGGGRLVRSMACSGLLPKWLATVQKDATDAELEHARITANKRRRLISTSSRKSDKNSKPSAVGMIFNNLITNCSKVLPAGPPPGMNVVAVETVEEKPGGTSSRKVAPSPTKDAAPYFSVLTMNAFEELCSI
eukprot:gene10248-11343_t